LLVVTMIFCRCLWLKLFFIHMHRRSDEAAPFAVGVACAGTVYVYSTAYEVYVVPHL
jgi:hypothetical protein